MTIHMYGTLSINYCTLACAVTNINDQAWHFSMSQDMVAQND
jgi:hypothetical protein